MARYARHVIAETDTLEQIAQRYYGDATNWYPIVQYNNLAYPYIVDSTEEKLNNIEGLVTTGDEIIVPVEQNILDHNLDNLNQHDRDTILDLALGRDLSMIAFPEKWEPHSNDTEMLGLSENGRGDLQTVSGVENVKQAVIARLLTPMGSLLLHPDYGSDVHRYIGERTAYNLLPVIDNEILRTIKADGRIQRVDHVSSNIDKDVYYGEFICHLRTIEDYFELVVSMDDSDNIAIS